MKMKKILLGLAIVLPLSMGTLGIAAQAHAHVYIHRVDTISASPGSHPYIDDKGVLRYCDIVNYTKREYDQCECGSIINLREYNEVVHYQCGQ